MKKILLPLLVLFFGVFLLYPLLYVVQGAFFAPRDDGTVRFTLDFFTLVFQNELYRASFCNSLLIGTATTITCLVLTLPLALAFHRLAFPGKRWLQAAMLAPLILPPFVGAIGFKHFFARFGSLNLLLMDLGILSPQNPIDWFGQGGLVGIIAMEVLHLFPILFLSVSAALANIDPSLRDAAANLGARGFYLFRTVTFPLAMPGVFAGCSIVFVSAFTDLGTPLIFDFQATVPTQIFNTSSESSDNPVGFALVLLTLLLVLACFLLGKKFGDAGSHAMMARSSSTEHLRFLPPLQSWLVSLSVAGLLLAALSPHLGVLLSSFSDKWFMSVLPDRLSGQAYGEVFADDFTALSIRNSLVYSLFSSGLDLVLGIAIAHLLARETFPGKSFLDAVAMLPLALPGLVLAFGYLAGFNTSIPWLAWLNPRNDPTVLLIVSYSVRRLPYIVRAAYAGYQQTSVTLEEASLNLGASRWRTMRKITLPLIAANLVAGTLLTFSFAMLEVSDSLLLAMETRFAPITKAIYELMQRPYPQAASLACALGVLAMLLLAVSLLLASRILGRKMGQLFRA
jgi:iron(III) transport system permease protein